MFLRKVRLVFIICALLFANLFANIEQDTLTNEQIEREIDITRLAIVGGAIGASYITTYYALLKDGWWSEENSFQWENNKSDWRYASNLDKFGHFYAGVFGGQLFSMCYYWAGLSPFASTLWAGITVSVTQVLIEVKDGFSPYGYSVWDAMAGSLGGFYAMAKEFVPAMQYIDYKFTYYPNARAYWDYYSDEGTAEQSFDGDGVALNDYYGGNQTHWLSFKVAKMLPSGARDFYPAWLAFAFGWGIDGLYYKKDYEFEKASNYEFYLSLDYDFEAIFNPQKTWSKNIVKLLNLIKFPAPTLRVGHNAKFFPLHPWYGFSFRI